MDLRKFRSTLGQHPLAYFSAEFALDERLPIYSGGLGVLAGDIVRQANDLELPFVAVGLLYKRGYFTQKIALSGEQREYYPTLEIEDAPIELVVNTEGQRILVTIPIEKQQISAQIWEYAEGDVSLYLLDTDIPENSAADRTITHHLYMTDPRTRIVQDIILGIGGVRALMQLHVHPSIFHLNESHSAFAIFEITHHYMDEYGMSFHDAYEYSRQKIVFTNHTLVEAGHEVFRPEHVTEILQTYAQQLGLPMEEILAMGRDASTQDGYSLSRLALNMACRTNTVSKLHSKIAKTVWPDKNMPPITNGVHLPTWVSPDIKAQAPGFDLSDLEALLPKELWLLHLMAKHRLIDEVKFQTGHSLNSNELIISWARRIVGYKQPELVFFDIKKLQAILYDPQRPVQLIIAGKAHPSDAIGHSHVANILRSIKENKLGDRVIFIPNYTISGADVLVSGSDLWINTPKRGAEASGTSGMKSGANGVLQCSVSDGWVDEVDLQDIGWILSETNTSDSLYHLLSSEIIPLFYDQNADGVPEEWVARMKRTMALIWGRFSGQRMLEEYIDILYRPALELESIQKHQHHWRQSYRTRTL